MKLLSYLLVIILVVTATKGFSQITLNEKNTPLPQVIRSIEKQTGYLFIYDEAKVKLGNVSVELKNASLYETLMQCFKNSAITYTIVEKNIVLKPRIVSPATDTIARVIKPQPTFLITGKITDAKGETIPGAIMFLANTRLMTTANSDGVFTLGNIKPGSYELIVKMIGFTPYTQSVTIQNQSVNLSIKLSENNIDLNEIVISGKKDPNQDKYMKLFIKNFIGETPNAEQCQILNPDVIKLHYDKKNRILQATSDKFIVIENRALGYKLNYLLFNFQLNLAEINTFSYEGNPYFEQLPCSKPQQKQWDEKRKIAYEGSIRHFFKSLFNNTSEAEGFSAYLIPNGASKDIDFQPINPNTLCLVVNDDLKLLNLNVEGNTKRLYIVYRNEEEPSSFFYSAGHIELPGNLNKKTQVSHIEPFTSNILLNKNGSISPANSLYFEGYWTREKVADLMPID